MVVDTRAADDQGTAVMGGVMQERVQMVHVGRADRCACGEDLRAGERVGQLDGDATLVCLWCLADLQAGRERPRRRARVSPPMPADPLPVRHPKRQRRRSSGGRPRGTNAVPLVVTLLLLGVALYVHPKIFGSSAPDTVAGVPIAGGDVPSWIGGSRLIGGGTDTRGIWPPTPPDARSEPLGSPGSAESSSTDYAFMSTISALDGRPVAWDPCRPIHVMVNNGEAPPGADSLVREAADKVTAATGLQFVIEGATSEASTSGRGPMDPERYGDRWSPVLVAWTDPSVVPDLDGPVAGFAGPVGAPYYRADQQHWVSGVVNLDGPQLSDVLRRADGPAAVRAIIAHEFGHLVGLTHSPSPSELMYEENIGQREFGPGDREGLRQLGLGTCFS